MYECSIIRDLTYAKACLSEILDCSESDTSEILRLCTVHGSSVHNMAKVHIDANPGKNWSFATFVEGVYISVLNELEGAICSEQYERLEDIQLDDEPYVWVERDGGIAYRGDAGELEAVIFLDMCRYGVTFDRIEALKEAEQVHGVQYPLSGLVERAQKQTSTQKWGTLPFDWRSGHDG